MKVAAACTVGASSTGERKAPFPLMFSNYEWYKAE